MRPATKGPKSVGRGLPGRRYRLAVAWQNVSYNQPPHPSYFIGD
ncbi:rhamnogalacturonan lyase family protein [Promicromonospora soli]